MLSRPWPRVVSSSGSRRRGAWLCLACWFRFSAGGAVFVGLRRIQVRRNGLLSFVPDEVVVCPRRVLPLSCRIASLPQRAFLPLCVSASRCQVVIPRLTRYPGLQVRRNGHSWLFSGFRISAELQVAVKAMTTTDCLACGGMCSLRNDGCRLPGFTPGCCSGKTFLPFCVSASRCQVVIPRLTRYPGLQVRRNGHSWLFSGFRISAELQVAVKAMTTTDCLACGRVSTLS